MNQLQLFSRFVMCFSFVFFGCLLLSCNTSEKKQGQSNGEAAHLGQTLDIEYAEGFSITEHKDFQLIEIKEPWPDAEHIFRYALVKNDTNLPDTLSVDAVISVPVKSIVVTSTTHIPSLEMLGVLDYLVGFPGVAMISSSQATELVNQGHIQEVGKNEAINTEVVINLQPDVVVGFGVDGSNKTFQTLQRAGINVVYNGDWMEQHPLGKAEWIKFFGALFDRSEEADTIFNSIAKAYHQTKSLAQTAETAPTVFSGALWNDVWYMPRGDSWGAQFIKDANGRYLWDDTSGTGSLALSVETVLEQAAHADYWIGPAQYTSLSDMEGSHQVYTKFKAFERGKVYSFSVKKGIGGGIVYYELAPNRPDLVLKDMVKILHPELLPEYELYFFEKLD